MNVYDQAHVLAAVLKRCEEYQKYKKTREEAFKLEQNVKLIQNFKKKQFQAQAALLSGEKIDDKTMEELKNMGNVMQFNREVSEFMAAEYQMNQMMSDVFKILGEAVDLNLDFMNEQE
ncbi:MAG: YlbF family regulator [Christensenellales bacterium]